MSVNIPNPARREPLQSALQSALAYYIPGVWVRVCAVVLVSMSSSLAFAQQKIPTPAVPSEILNGTGVALSGDTLTVSGTSIRLYGIAAPLAGQTCETRYGKSYDCYRRSTDVLQVLIGGLDVVCTVTTKDRNGQKIGVCRAGGSDLAGAIVSRGWAFAYRRLTPAYIGNETFAESRRLGIWAGKVEMPWQWRSRHLSD